MTARLGEAPRGAPAGLTPEQRDRYARHVALPEVGEDGQARLLGARFLLVGVGGLGSPVALYLAAAGVGAVGVVDDDIVETADLQRQVLHSEGSVGASKVDSAREAILALNPDATVETHRERLDAANVISIMSRYDAVIDGSDNYPTRYLINDASVRLGTPVVHGSVRRFEGRVAVFDPRRGPCYRCLHRLPPPSKLTAAPVEAGVIGALPGVVGSIQAMEALKIALGADDSLVGRLMIYDALEPSFTTVKVERDPDCPACSDPSRPPPIADYDETCRPPA